MKISQDDFIKMLTDNKVDLLEHLVLATANDEVIKSYEEKKSLEILITINGVEIDVMPFLKMFEKQYDEQCLVAARDDIMSRMEKALKPFFEASEQFQEAWDTMQREAKKAVAKAVDADWLFDKREY